MTSVPGARSAGAGTVVAGATVVGGTVLGEGGTVLGTGGTVVVGVLVEVLVVGSDGGVSTGSLD
jgi:hypothetical protein